jgi:hypothetical protein
MADSARMALENPPVPTKFKLALAWTSLMFLYIYNDYFSLYTPGIIQGMMVGRLGPLGPATDGVLVGVAMLLAIPSLMIFLSVVLPPFISRWLNVMLGLVYTAVEVMTFSGPHLFYKIVVGLEILLTLTITWLALRWPKRALAE